MNFLTTNIEVFFSWGSLIISVGEIDKKGFSKVTIYYEWKKYYRQISNYIGTPNVSNKSHVFRPQFR